MKTRATKTVFLGVLLAAAANAQLVMYAVTGQALTTVGSAYPVGQVPVGSTGNVQFQVFNTGISPVTIDAVTLGGAGFTFEYSISQLPFTIPGKSNAAEALGIAVSFSPTSQAAFSASLTVSASSGSFSTILTGSGAPALMVTTGAGCSTMQPFNWGNVMVGAVAPCAFSIQNPNTQAVTVTSLVVNGPGFSGPYGITLPLTLPPDQGAEFSINFSPTAGTAYAGTLVVGTQSFALSGMGLVALLPTPVLQFDSTSYSSAQQGVLTVTIPGGAPVAATGYVNLTFTPSTAVVKDDSEIAFIANGSRTIPWSVSAGATTALLNGQSSAVFQTGTTEGTITFTLSTAAALTGSAPSAKFTIAGTKVIIDSTSASKERTGYLDITIIGADNTYSTGAMAFSFFDTSGNVIGGAESADFASTFKTYYGGQTAGSAFQALVSFPVIGSVATIGSVTVTLTNAAGVASTGSLTFQ